MDCQIISEIISGLIVGQELYEISVIASNESNLGGGV